jgi:hypothetical protein
MKNNMLHSSAPATPVAPSENEIRDYAYHLYEQNSRIPGRDLENWTEAKACLAAHISAHDSHLRLQHYIASHEHGQNEQASHSESEHARSALHPLDWLRSSLHHT